MVSRKHSILKVRAHSMRILISLSFNLAFRKIDSISVDFCLQMFLLNKMSRKQTSSEGGGMWSRARAGDRRWFDFKIMTLLNVYSHSFKSPVLRKYSISGFLPVVLASSMQAPPSRSLIVSRIGLIHMCIFLYYAQASKSKE
jgi:hypothetical protein